MANARTQPARGMRDFLPADVRRREYVIGVIKEVYERYGFEPLETPAVENIETLMGKYGEEGNQLIFKILKRGVHESTGEADLALRYDLTVPLARVVAEYLDKLDKIGREGVAKEFKQRGLSDQPGERLLDFFVELNSLDHAAEIAIGDDAEKKNSALNAAILGRLVEFVGDNEAGAKGIDEL